MWKVALEKKSERILAVEVVSLKRTGDEKPKEIEKLDEVIENMGKHKKCMWIDRYLPLWQYN